MDSSAYPAMAPDGHNNVLAVKRIMGTILGVKRFYTDLEPRGEAGSTEYMST